MRFQILFQQKNPVDQAHGSVDCGRTAVYGGPGPALFPGEEGSSGRREHAGEVAAVVPGQASGGRRRSGSLTGWACLSVRGRRRGRLGRKGREGVGHGWAGLERKGRGWAAAGLGSKGREEARPKSLLGLKSKRVKENQF
jgi:hypothetical protein